MIRSSRSWRSRLSGQPNITVLELQARDAVGLGHADRSALEIGNDVDLAEDLQALPARDPRPFPHAAGRRSGASDSSRSPSTSRQAVTMPRFWLNQLARRTRPIRLVVSPTKSRMCGRQLRGSFSCVRNCSRATRVSATHSPARTSPQRFCMDRRRRKRYRASSRVRAATQATGLIRNMTTTAASEPSRETNQGTLMVGRKEGSPDKPLEGRAEVDHHVEGQEQDRDELGHVVQPAQQHRGQGDGPADPGRHHRLSGPGEAGHELGRQAIRGQGLQHTRPAQGAAEGRGQDGPPQSRIHQPGPQHGHLRPGADSGGGHFLGAHPAGRRQQDRYDQVDQGSGQHGQQGAAGNGPLRILQIAAHADAGRESRHGREEHREHEPEPARGRPVGRQPLRSAQSRRCITPMARATSDKPTAIMIGTLELEGHGGAPTGNGGGGDHDARRQNLDQDRGELLACGRAQSRDGLGQTEAVEGDAQGPAQKQGNADGAAQLDAQAPGNQEVLAADARPACSWPGPRRSDR